MSKKKLWLTISTLALLLTIIGGGIASANAPTVTPAMPAQRQGVSPWGAPLQDGAFMGRGRGAPTMAAKRLSGDLFKVIADKLGLSVQELRTEMRSGKSILVIAGEKNVTLDQLTQAVVDGATTKLQEKVDNKQITTQQMNWLLGQMQDRVKNMLLHQGAGRSATPLVQKDEWQAVADSLGMTAKDFQKEMRTRSLAAIAEEKGVTLSDLVQTMVNTRQTALNTLVNDGKITQAQADAILSDVQTAWQDCAGDSQGLACHWGFIGRGQPGRHDGRLNPGRGHRGGSSFPGLGSFPGPGGNF